MSAASRMGDYAEERAAKKLGTARIGGKRKRRRVPDTESIRMSDGSLVQAEVKARKYLPATLIKWLAQAVGYTPGSIPLLVLSAKGQRGALVVLDLDHFTRLVGLRDPVGAEQLALALTVDRGPNRGR